MKDFWQVFKEKDFWIPLIGGISLFGIMVIAHYLDTIM